LIAGGQTRSEESVGYFSFEAGTIKQTQEDLRSFIAKIRDIEDRAGFIPAWDENIGVD